MKFAAPLAFSFGLFAVSASQTLQRSGAPNMRVTDKNGKPVTNNRTPTGVPSKPSDPLGGIPRNKTSKIAKRDILPKTGFNYQVLYNDNYGRQFWTDNWGSMSFRLNGNTNPSLARGSFDPYGAGLRAWQGSSKGEFCATINPAMFGQYKGAVFAMYVAADNVPVPNFGIADNKYTNSPRKTEMNSRRDQTTWDEIDVEFFANKPGQVHTNIYHNKWRFYGDASSPNSASYDTFNARDYPVNTNANVRYCIQWGWGWMKVWVNGNQIRYNGNLYNQWSSTMKPQLSFWGNHATSPGDMSWIGQYPSNGVVGAYASDVWYNPNPNWQG